MILKSPNCGTDLRVVEPGDVACPGCGERIEVGARNFAWDAGPSLDDSRPGAPGDKAPADNVPTAARIDETPPALGATLPVCEVCGKRPATRACASCGRV
ncbi:hypothetical protein K8I61_01705, partial [bacterium]|nr:hypothetical protein [bacterium]